MCSGNQQIENQDLAVQKAQTAMTQTLNNSYGQAFANQQNVLAAQQARLSAQVANPQGYTPQQLAGATTSINENTATAAKQAIGSAAAFAAAHGGASTSSGAAGQLAGEIASGAALAKSQQLSQLSQQNQAMKQQNYWNGIQGLSQVGSAYGQAAGTAAGSSAGVASSGSQAGEAAFQAMGPSTLGSIAQFAAEAGGDVATAMGCVTPDTSIALADGASKKASDIKPGDVLYGIDGDVRVRHVETSVQPAVEITLNDGTTIVVSESHTFSLPSGGYVEAGEAHGQTLRILAGPAQVKSVARIGMQPVIRLRVGGSHTYLSNGIWSLE